MKRSGTDTTAKFEPAKPSFDPVKSSAAGGGVDVVMVRALAEVLGAFDLSEIEVQEGDMRVRLTRQAAAKAPYALAAAPEGPAGSRHPAPEQAAAVAVADNPGVVKSPMVGTVYRRPSPDAKPLVEIGNQIKAGDRVLLVEAMKTFNDITAHRSGTITEILVEDGQPVEYGEPLMIIV